jgi:hypothetical protein
LNEREKQERFRKEMKRIVINKCFGGFRLSVEAKKEIAKIGCPHLHN